MDSSTNIPIHRNTYIHRLQMIEYLHGHKGFSWCVTQLMAELIGLKLFFQAGITMYEVRLVIY